MTIDFFLKKLSTSHVQTEYLQEYNRFGKKAKSAEKLLLA